MGGLSISHWLIIIVVLLVFFGPSRLPGLGKSIGEAIKGFKEGLDSADDPPKNNSQPPARQQIAEHSSASQDVKAQELKTETGEKTAEKQKQDS